MGGPCGTYSNNINASRVLVGKPKGTVLKSYVYSGDKISSYLRDYSASKDSTLYV